MTQLGNALNDRGLDNEIYAGENVELTGHINGNGNKLFFAGSREPSIVHIELNGDGNFVQCKRAHALKGLFLAIGNHVPAHRTRLLIDENLSIESGGRILLYTSGGSLSIGAHCMFSSGITLRCGESPHLIFDTDGRFLDTPRGMTIGDHVWIGEDAYLTKSSSVADECVVGARSVVTRLFTERHCAIAGNPATVVRRDVQWIRNRHHLVAGSRFAESHDAFHAAFGEAVHLAEPRVNVASPAEATEAALMRRLLWADHAIDAKNAEITRLQDALQALERSTSWRVTRPLRALKRLVSKGVR